MKTKKDSKFTLEKFEVAKFKNLETIIGGDGGGVETITRDSVNKSGVLCINIPPPPPLLG